MNIEACFYFGFTQKTIGTKGELAFKMDVDSPSSYLGIDAILLQVQPKDTVLVPFFIEQSSLQNNGLLRCKLEGIDSQADAKALVGKSLFLPLELLPELKGNQFYFHEIIGFKVIDQEKGAIGSLSQVLEYPKSNLLSILSGEKEILIPITDESIVSLDREKKELIVAAPEGLIDLYLEG